MSRKPALETARTFLQEHGYNSYIETSILNGELGNGVREMYLHALVYAGEELDKAYSEFYKSHMHLISRYR